MQEEGDLTAANARLAQMGFAGGTSFEPKTVTALDNLAQKHLGPAIDAINIGKAARKPRSDKGKPKPAKIAAEPVQAVNSGKLGRLNQAYIDAFKEQLAVDRKVNAAYLALQLYIRGTDNQ